MGSFTTGVEPAAGPAMSAVPPIVLQNDFKRPTEQY